MPCQYPHRYRDVGRVSACPSKDRVSPPLLIRRVSSRQAMSDAYQSRSGPKWDCDDRGQREPSTARSGRRGSDQCCHINRCMSEPMPGGSAGVDRMRVSRLTATHPLAGAISHLGQVWFGLPMDEGAGIRPIRDVNRSIALMPRPTPASGPRSTGQNGPSRTLRSCSHCART